MRSTRYVKSQKIETDLRTDRPIRARISYVVRISYYALAPLAPWTNDHTIRMSVHQRACQRFSQTHSAFPSPNRSVIFILTRAPARGSLTCTRKPAVKRRLRLRPPVNPCCRRPRKIKNQFDCFLFWVLKQTRQVEVPIGSRGGFVISMHRS